MKAFSGPSALLLGAIVAGSLAIGTPAPAQSDDSIFERSDTSTIQFCRAIQPSVAGVQGRGRRASGSAFVIDAEKRMLLTTISVARSRGQRVTLRFSDYSSSTAIVAGRDEATNSALLIAERLPESARALPLADSDEVKVGTMVFTFGNPYQSAMRVGEIAASLGVISGIYPVRTGNIDYEGEVFELDAAVNPGSFGGPVVDLEGRVVAIVDSTYSHARWLGASVPISPVARWVESFLASELAARNGQAPRRPSIPAFLGLVLSRGEKGATIESIVSGSPAETNPLETGDVLVQAGDVPIRTPRDWKQFLREQRPGQRIRLVLLREGELVRIEVLLGSRFM